ncbi:hypothetical protein BGX31_002034 [Mortierella sp. GBA43]|nr:hypothetical protein BGX31_002034 [Mortierella sp. GBA43]
MKWSQYISLVKREPRNEVTLDDADSVTLLTKSLSKFSNITTRLTIHVNSEYFEASDRANGARFKAIRHLFQELGQVLNRQKKLTHLKIHADSTRGQVYSGLRAVLKSRTLKSLCISGIPCFFQSADIPIKCRELEELSLHGVYLNDEQSARHLWRLVEVNSGLVKLKMAGYDRGDIDTVEKD